MTSRLCLHRVFLPPAALMLTLAMLAPTLASAQSEAPEDLRTVIKSLRYANAGEVAEALSVLPIRMQTDAATNSLVVRARPEHLEAALAAIENLDNPRAPAPSLEVVGYVLAASPNRSSDQSLPDGLKGAVAQLRELFNYGGFHLLDTLFLRISNGSEGSVTGTLRTSGHPGLAQFGYALSFADGHIVGFDRIREAEEPRTLRFNGLSLDVETSGRALRTDLEIREGQTAVVGKARVEGIQEDLILVLRARVLE